MTKVTLNAGKFIWLVLVLGCMSNPAVGQQSAPASSPGPAESLYLKLRGVGLDKTKVFSIREGALDRAAIHISLDDGTIAFTESVAGHITGAFFQGDGEVLLSPPNTMERASLALFTGGAILEEKFSTAYFRFNDAVYDDLKPFLRLNTEDRDAFVSQWNATAKNLAEQDALRVLLTLDDLLPADELPGLPNPNDHLMHATLQGNKLGAFDVWYDSLSQEQVAVGQRNKVEGQDYYDVWASFSVQGSSTLAYGQNATETPNFDFDITSFKVRAEIKLPKELDAKVALSVVARKDCRRTLLFELSRRLQVSEVRANGRPVEFIHNQAIEGSQLAKRGNDVVAVILPSSLRAGQRVELTFAYSGSVLSEAANGLLYVGDHGTWYPNRGLAMASFDLQFRYPAGWTLVATGQRTEQKPDGGEQVSRWMSERPVPLAGFNLGKYSQTVTYAGKVAVATYATSTLERGFPGTTAPPVPVIPTFPKPGGGYSIPFAQPPQLPSPSRNEQMVGSTSARAVEFYERHFGPFPYRELAITQIPGATSQGWPGLIFLSSYSFLSPQEKEKLETDPGRRLRSDQVIAHETAHQWWGDVVTWKSYRDQWIMEGLANYSALMLLESHDPPKFRQIMQNYRDDLIGKNRNGKPLTDAGPVTLGVRLSSSRFPDAYEAVCYGRGTWLFHMLRTMMRDGERKGQPVPGYAKPAKEEPFLRALRKLRTDYEDKAVSTSELMAIFESDLPPALWYEGHKSLAWFYDGWVNGNAVPGFELRGLKFTDKRNSTLVTGTIVQEYAPESLVTAVPVYASSAGKNAFLGRIFAEGKETQFRVTAPQGTRKVVLDPEQTLLARSR